jgi:hypothetical protein
MTPDECLYQTMEQTQSLTCKSNGVDQVTVTENGNTSTVRLQEIIEDGGGVDRMTYHRTSYDDPDRDLTGQPAQVVADCEARCGLQRLLRHIKQCWLNKQTGWA